jgi:hypothetical protein
MAGSAITTTKAQIPIHLASNQTDPIRSPTCSLKPEEVDQYMPISLQYFSPD